MFLFLRGSLGYMYIRLAVRIVYKSGVCVRSTPYRDATLIPMPRFFL